MNTFWRENREWIIGPLRRLSLIAAAVWTVILGALGGWLYIHASSPKDVLHATLLAPLLVPLWLIWLLGLIVNFVIAWMAWKFRKLQSAPTSNKSAELTARLKRMQMMASASESLLSAASSMTASDKRSLENVLTSYLGNIYNIFGGQVRRLDILVPEGRKLVSIASHRMPKEDMIYDLDDTSAKPGIYVYAFRTGFLEIAHFREENGEWKCDHSQYKLHRDLTQKPPHTTFVIVPMKDADAKVKGVVCLDNDEPLDSNGKGIFDQPEMQPILTGIGANIASVVTLWENLGGETS